MAPNLKLILGPIFVTLLDSSKSVFVSLVGSSFSQIALICVHSLFKIIPLRYSEVFPGPVFMSQHSNFHVFTST